MAGKGVPRCSRCGQEHYNFLKECPPPRQPVQVVWRNEPGDGFKVSSGWGGRNTKGVPIIYTLPPRRRSGSLTGADGQPYVPDIPDAA